MQLAQIGPSPVPQPVDVADLSGDALQWFKLLVAAQLVLGVAVILLLVALAVVTLWRGA